MKQTMVETEQHKGAAHVITSIFVFFNSMREWLNDRKVLTSLFYEDAEEEQENSEVEEEEIPEDKDYEKDNPEYSESSSDNADIPVEHQGEKGTFLFRYEKITSLHRIAERRPDDSTW